MEIKAFSKHVHKTAIQKGWWVGRSKDLVTNTPRCLLNIHSEISEASEEARNKNFEMRIENGKPEGMVVELADAIIRILDTCEAFGLDIEGALVAKSNYNDTRPFRHGGKAY